jgi:hypothetical protein
MALTRLNVRFLLILSCLLLALPLPAAAQISSASDLTVPATISGEVTNGTATGTVPADLRVTLVITRDGNTISQLATLITDGRFTFNDVPVVDGDEMVAAAVYRGHVFSTHFAKVEAIVDRYNLPITLYEPTEDPAVITVSGTVVQASASGDKLEVRQVFQFRNHSDRLFTSSSDLGNGKFASVAITLPPGSQIVSFDNPDRYVALQEQYSVVDTSPVFPGDDHQMVVVYLLPYDGQPALLEQAFAYPFEGQARLLIWPDTLTVKSTQFPKQENQNFGDSTYATYGGELTLPAGEALRYELSGAAGAAPAPASEARPASANDILLVVVGLALLGAAIVAVFFLRGQRRPSSTNQKDSNA